MQSLGSVAIQVEDEALDDIVAQNDRHGILERNTGRKRHRFLGAFNNMPKWLRQLRKHEQDRQRKR